MQQISKPQNNNQQKNENLILTLDKTLLEFEFSTLFANHFKEFRERVWYKIYENVIDQKISFKEARNQWIAKNRLECTLSNPLNLKILDYAKKLNIEVRTEHPDAKCIHSGEYSDYYKCPHCSLEFKVELPDA